MTEHSVSRTIVKSPPELWAELSDPAALGRHLGELGEITITRLEPEHTVAWEGERARGTVELEPAGWGTKVTLEAAAAEEPAEEEPPVEAVAPEEEVPAETPRPRLLSRLLGRRRRAGAVAVEEPPPVEEEPVAEEPPADEGLSAVLTSALDALGTAHHRPFSRG